MIVDAAERLLDGIDADDPEAEPRAAPETFELRRISPAASRGRADGDLPGRDRTGLRRGEDGGFRARDRLLAADRH
ncbi:MAG: hypothetical protein U0R71_09725 [Solirubrobacterales bacterium]